MSLDDTLAAIDAVTTICQQCGRLRGDSPSIDYCSEICQRDWLRRRLAGIPLDVHPEPLVEVTVDTSRFDAAASRITAALARIVSRKARR